MKIVHVDEWAFVTRCDFTIWRKLIRLRTLDIFTSAWHFPSSCKITQGGWLCWLWYTDI